MIDSLGEVLCAGDVLSLAPGCLPTLWQNDDRYVESYLSAQSGYYLTGDAGMKDEDGYLFYAGRKPEKTFTLRDVLGNIWRRGPIEGKLEELYRSQPVREQIALVVGETNECDYCVSAHTALGQQAWLYGVDGVGPSRAGIFGNLVPVSALFFSFLILGEPVGGREIAGVGLILLGVWLVNHRAQAQRK